ncbi:hypothetical protein M9Y10_026521 [Tritrichomonas musculus]
MTSIDDPSSFQTIDIWKELLETSCDQFPPCILAVNKIDLEDSSGKERNDINQKFSDKFESIIYVSALSGEGVDNLFLWAAQIGFDFFQKNTTKKKTIDIEETQKGGCC